MRQLYKTKNMISKNFHALTHKNFRYFWLGQCASLIGTWMQNTGQSWLVLTITNRPLLLGILGVVQFAPITVFSLFVGTIIDRYPKKKILIFTQTASMLLAFALSLLVFTHTARYAYILIIAFLLGCVNCIDMPTRQTFTVEIAGREDLMNAIALNSAIFNLARILGPGIAGLVMAYCGAGWCFFFNGISYLAVLYGLFNIKVESYVRKPKNDNNVIEDLVDGLKYVVKSSVLSQTMLMIFIVGVFGFNYNILVPSFTKLVLHQNEKTYGLLMALLGVGSLIGAITVSIKSKRGPKLKILYISSFIMSIMLMLNGFNKNLVLTGMLLLITGVFNIYFSTTANSTIQLRAKDEYRGRVMSIYTFLFAGSTPIGNYFTGSVSDKLGPSQGFFLSGIIVIVSVVLIKLLFINRANEEVKAA